MYKDVVVAQKFCTRKIEQCFEDVSKVFHRSLKSTSRKFQRWLSQVVGVLQVCFKEISRNLEGVLSSLMMFHDSFKVSSSMFHPFFKLFWLFLSKFNEEDARRRFCPPPLNRVKAAYFKICTRIHIGMYITLLLGTKQLTQSRN